MENFIQNEIKGYKILLILQDSILKIYVKDMKRIGNDKIEFLPIQMKFKDHLKEYISDFNDLFEKIREGNNIIIDLKEELSINNNDNKKYIKNLNITIGNNDINKIFISKKIYPLNIKYYLTKGPNNERINSKPFSSCIKKDFFNIDEINEIIEKEKVLKNYIIDNITFYHNQKNAFIPMRKQNIQIKGTVILEFHIEGVKNNSKINLRFMENYYTNEIIKIKNETNKYSDIVKQYDLIFLYSSPIISNDEYKENKAPISYMKEIRIILDLMRLSGKKFNCKFECIGEDVLRDVLKNFKTKILHISGHGFYDEKEKYFLNVENLKNKGKSQNINIKSLKYFLANSNKKNLSQIDLAIVSTCYSEEFAKSLLDYGVKNVIYTKEKTEVINNISVLFTKYFYKYLLTGNTIDDSYNMAKKKLKTEVAENVSRCKNHFHKIKASRQFEHIEFRKIFRNCKCNYEKHNYHNIDCHYYKKFKEKIKSTEETKKEITKNIFAICCCDYKIEHDEIEKISYEQPLSREELKNISTFKFNPKGKLFIDSTISFYYDVNKYDSIEGRKGLIGRIFNSITNGEKFAIFYGEKYMGKLDFAESLCVYLYERKIIENYEIFRISSKEDFNEMENKLIEDKKNIKFNINKRKNIIIINFDKDDDRYSETNYDYLINTYKKFINVTFDNLYFIFIFNIKDEKLLKEDIENYFKRKMKKEILITKDVNLFNAESNKPTSDEEIDASHNELLESENKSSYLLYYLLSIMPSGLPDRFLEIIFINYSKIKDNKNLISETEENNWKIIRKDKHFEENFKETQYTGECKQILFRTLKLYTKLLYYFIDKNREKILYKDGNIHYVYNSYNDKDIWDCKLANIMDKSIEKRILNEDFDIAKHKCNIISLISFIINKIESFRESGLLKNKIHNYLEAILLLFPSYFFLKKDNLEVLQNCIESTKKLIEKTGGEYNKDAKEREEKLKNKLLLFLYSINESQTDILEVENIEDDLKKELEYLEAMRKEKFLTATENEKELKHLESLKQTFPVDINFYYYYELSKAYFIKGKYKDCQDNLNNALNCNYYLSDLIKNRINININQVFKRQLIEDKKGGKNQKAKDDNYDLVKNQIKQLKQIMENPTEKHLYYEAYYLREDLYNLLDPDIIMLSSNPLNIKPNKFYSSNNQYYILNELKNTINSHIRIKFDILNIDNLNSALKRKGEILIIQSDYFTKNVDIICESEIGKCIILSKEDFIEMFKKQKIEYKIIILAFPNSSLLIEDFNNSVDYQYLITFNTVNYTQEEWILIKDSNKQLIQFIIDFIIETEKNNNTVHIEYIINSIKNKVIRNKNNSADYIKYKKKSNKSLTIEYKNSIKGKKLFLYGPFLKLKNIHYDFSEDDCSKIYDLVEYLNKEKNKVFYCDILNKRKTLYISYEVMKFYYRHKTFCEYFIINIQVPDDKDLLQSIIRKQGKIKDEVNEELDEGDTPKRSCFILIYNCKWYDLSETNIYSLYKSNSSFIIIFDKENNFYNYNEVNEMKIKLKAEETDKKDINITISVAKLKNILEQKKEIKTLVEKSIAKAKEINPDKNTNPVQSLEEFYKFIEASLTQMPWDILDDNFYEEHNYIDISFKTEQSILYPYWLLDIPLDELKDNKKFHNSVQYIDEIADWLSVYCNEWKDFLDSSKSWNEDILQIFKNDPEYQLDKDWYEDSSNWKSFNHFFSRRLKENSRPIEKIDDDSIIISPVDSLPQGVWNIDKEGKFIADEIKDDKGVTLKSTTFIEIEQLLGEKCKKYGKNFYGGKLTHSILQYNDYHRFHFPISGSIVEAEIIKGSPSVGGIVYWDPESKSYILKNDSLSWQAYETRGAIILNTCVGYVALLPIGMGQMSSVNFEKNIEKDFKVKKGDPLGCFLYGGSDFVMIFEERAKFEITAKKVEEGIGYGFGYQHILMGEQYGTVKINK